MSNRPKYYKLRERTSSRNQNTQISQFFNSEDNPQSIEECKNNDQNYSDAPPLKKPRELLQEPENRSVEKFNPACSTTDPGLGDEENVEAKPSLTKQSSTSTKLKRNTKVNAKNSIKEFFEQNDSDGELEAPKRKIAKKATVQKFASRGKRGGGRTRRRQTTIKSALLKNEEIFSEFVAQHSKAENVDPYELQLALAISKSEVETSGRCEDSAEDRTSENSDLIKNTRERLKDYGFKITGNERDYDIIFKAGSKKGKWANKFTPLTLRDHEKQAKKLEEKTAQILNCSSPEIASRHTNNEFVMTSDFLQMFTADRDLCRTLHQNDSSYVYDYYVIELFPASDVKVGYLLKDWRKIPGRDLSPPRKKTEIKNESPEMIPGVIPNASENENNSPNLIAATSKNENDLAESISDASGIKTYFPYKTPGSPKNESKLDVISVKPINENYLPKKSMDLHQNELSQEIILSDDDQLAVNVSETLNLSVDYPKNDNVLCIEEDSKERKKLISLPIPDVETVEDEKKEPIVKKKSLIDSNNAKNILRYQPRETSPDLFEDSDTSFCEGIDNCEDSKEVQSLRHLETFSEQKQQEPPEENFVFSYENYSSDEVKVTSHITHASPKSSKKEFVRQPSLKEYCIDLTGHSNSNSGSDSQERENPIKNENNEINSVNNAEVSDSIMPEMNLLQASQNSDYSNNISQSQNNQEKDLTEDSCIVLSDDEVNYSIKVANKTFLDSVDLTFISSSEDDREKRKKTNYNIKMSGPKIDQNFSFIALIGETNTISPSKSVDSLNINSPKKISSQTNFQNDIITPARRNLFLSQNTSIQHNYSITARKSLSFSNSKTNSQYKISPFILADEDFVGEELVYDKYNAAYYDEKKPQGKLLLNSQSKHFNKQLSPDEEFVDVEHGVVTFSKFRKSRSPLHTITREEKKIETTSEKNSWSYRTLSDSYIKSKNVMKSHFFEKYSTSQESDPHNLADEELIGERLNYDEFNAADCDEKKLQNKQLSTKSSNHNKLFSSDVEFFDDEISIIKFSEQRKNRKHSHTIVSIAENKKETTLEKSSCRNRALTDSYITSTAMKSPILKKYATSQKFSGFINDDVDFSDVDEIDKLVYSPIKQLTPKKPQHMDKLLHAELSFTDKNSPRKYVHDGKTYLVRTENISPKPNYARMDSPTILNKLYKYGIKPLKRKHAVAILEHIYDQTHPFIVENGDDDSSDDEDILRISQSPLKGLQIQKSSQTNKNIQSSYNTFNLEDCTGENLLDFDDLSPEIDEEEYIFPTNIRSKISTAHLPFHIAWNNAVKSNYALREALLHYEPIDLQEIYLFLKKLGYRYEPKDMKRFLDKRCIIFRYDLSDGTSNRHVRKNKMSQRAF